MKLRPTFVIRINDSRDEAIAKLSGTYDRQQALPAYLLFGEYGELHLPSESLRLWSPHLSFYVTQEDGQPVIRGRFAPRVEVWTLVWIIYLAMACSCFFGSVFGLSQWLLGTFPWGFIIAIASGAIILILYIVASAGQQLSQDQMQLLRSKLDQLLKVAMINRPPVDSEC
jgi:hypothetical protein